MKRKYLNYFTILFVGYWLILQIVFIILTWNVNQVSDAANYAIFARNAFEQTSWYPTFANFNDDLWVANPGYINFLVLNLKIFHTLSFVSFEQLLFNILLLLSLWKISTRLGGQNVGKIVIILFCILPSNAMMVPAYMSDLMGLSLVLYSFAILKCDFKRILISGMLLAIANWVRPIAIIFIPSLIIFSLCRRVPWYYYASYIIGFAIVCIGIVSLTKYSCNHYLLGSTTKGTNMIIGCWDHASGGYDKEVFLPGNPGYIEKAERFNVVQKDSILTDRSIQWIQSNPMKFISLIPMKMLRLWGSDIYADKVFFNPNKQISQPVRVFLSIPYYMIFFLFLLGIFKKRRQIFGIVGIILLPVLIGSGMHVLMYGGLRYHYPMMGSVVFLAAVALCSLLKFSYVFPNLKRPS